MIEDPMVRENLRFFDEESMVYWNCNIRDEMLANSQLGKIVRRQRASQPERETTEKDEEIVRPNVNSKPVTIEMFKEFTEKMTEFMTEMKTGTSVSEFSSRDMTPMKPHQEVMMLAGP